MVLSTQIQPSAQCSTSSLVSLLTFTICSNFISTSLTTPTERGTALCFTKQINPWHMESSWSKHSWPNSVWPYEGFLKLKKLQEGWGNIFWCLGCPPQDAGLIVEKTHVYCHPGWGAGNSHPWKKKEHAHSPDRWTAVACCTISPVKTHQL